MPLNCTFRNCKDPVYFIYTLYNKIKTKSELKRAKAP